MNAIANKPVYLLAIVLLSLSFLAYSGTAMAAKPEKPQAQAIKKAEIQKPLEPKTGLEPAVTQPLQISDTLLEALFSPGQVQDKAAFLSTMIKGFLVSDNALGDMNQDSLVNIWDLLRVRNIHLGIGDPPSSYETEEGDLNWDQVINQEDVVLFRDVLLDLAGIPHVIDSTGGTVIDRGIEITIPSDATDSTAILSVTHLSSDYLEEKYGIDIKAEEADSNWIMASFRFNSNMPVDFRKSPELTIRLDSLPPCSLRTFNALYNITPDTDGDGLPEIVNVGRFIPTPDSMGIELQIPPIPILDSIGTDRLGSFAQTSKQYSTNITLYVGERLRITGSDLSSGCVVHFRDPLDSMEVVMSLKEDSIGLFTLVPPHPAHPIEGGVVQVLLENQESRLRSVPFSGLNIAWSPDIPPYPDSTILAYFALLDSLSAVARDEWLTDTLIAPEDRNAFVQQIEEGMQTIGSVRDSALALPTDIRGKLASAISLSGILEQESFIAGLRSDGKGCIETCRKFAILIPFTHLSCDLVGLGLCLLACGASGPFYLACVFTCELGWAAVVCTPITVWEVRHIMKCYRDCPDDHDSCIVEYKLNPDSSDNYCPNIFRHRGKVCLNNTFYTGGVANKQDYCSQNKNLVFTENQTKQYTSFVSSCCQTFPPSPYHPLNGAIVKANKRLPFGAVGVVNGAGGFQLPGLPHNSTIVLSMYDPKTGLYDSSVATFETSSDENAVYSPIVIFNPDTTTWYVPLPFGEPETDTISVAKPRIEYWFTVTQEQIGDKINIGFWSESGLLFHLQDPSGEFILRDSSANCIFERGVVLDTAGTYRITVTYGMGAAQGPFEVGVNWDPYFPIHCLCGTISGVLTSNLSPYEAVDDITVASGDSLILNPDVNMIVSPSVTIGNNGYIHFENFDTSCFAVTASASLVNSGSINITSGVLDIGNGLTLSQAQDAIIASGGDTLSRIVILSGGKLTHERGALTGLNLAVDTVIVESGGSIDVTSKGYRGEGSDGWTGSRSETYPGYLGANNSCGGSHGGYGGGGDHGGSSGDVYDVVDDPFAFGAGGSKYSAGDPGQNGGGLIRLEVDVLELNGSLVASGGGTGLNQSSGGAGGTINLRAREVSGTGTVYANGGWSGYQSGGGGGGRIAIRWQEGDISGWTMMAVGHNGGTYGGHGGAGTIYLLGPDDGIDGRLIVDNLGRNGLSTPLPPERTQFKDVSVLGAAKLNVGMIGSLAEELTALDSLLVSGTYTQVNFSDSTSLSTPRLIGQSGSVTTLGEGMTLSVPQIWVDGGATLITETDLSFADATDFSLTGGGILDSRQMVTFTIPRFESDNVVSGTFRNWGILDVASDSIVIGSGVTLEESGLLGSADSISQIRVLGILSHGKWSSALSYDTQADTGLVLKVGKLVVESGGSIDVTSKGYRGKGRDGWTGSRSETYPGYLGANEACGGSHGGYGGGGDHGGSSGDVYDVVDDPFAFGAGGSNWSAGAAGQNGGGLVRLEVDQLVLNGSILANGGTTGSNQSSGGAGGTVNLRAREVNGAGSVTANGGSSGYESGGGGGGRIAIRWQEGDISGWTIATQGGSGGGSGGSPGNPGTVYIDNTSKKLTSGR